MIKQAAMGDMQALLCLYRQNYGLIWKWAMHYDSACRKNRACDVEDLTQCAFFAVYEAAKTFRPEAGGAWSTWLSWHLQNAMHTETNRDRASVMGEVSLDKPISEDAETTRRDLLMDETQDVLRSAEESEVAEMVREAVKRLPPALCDAVTAHKLLGVPFQDGEERRLTRKAVDTMSRDKILRKAWWAMRAEDLCYQHKGLSSFLTDWTSATEGAALRRIDLLGV